MIDERKFNTKSEFFKFLVENKEQLIAEKKFDMKKADSVSFNPTCFFEEKEIDASKSENITDLLQKEKLNAKVVINTTNLLDSHKDVHIDGIWNKTLNEQKKTLHLQEHQMSFDHVISTKVKPSVKKMTWKELGFEMEGETEALIFNSEIEKSRNPYMFEQYAKGYVDNHSVGMRYVKLFMCINSDEDYCKEEKANWDNYIDRVANKKEAEKACYFWAVTEAKLIEGSAVLAGSNWATPTQEIKLEPLKGTQNIEPPKGTQKENLFERIAELQNLKFKT